MSIYATILNFDGDGEERLGAPYVYRASHELPTVDGERRGWLEIASIEADFPDELNTDFLRVDCSASDDGDPSTTVLLDRSHVLVLVDRMTDWLSRHEWKAICPTCYGENAACHDVRHKCGCGAPLSEHEGGRCPKGDMSHA